MFAARGGERVRTRDLRFENVEGITLLGGEPFAQARACADVARLARARGLSVMVFSGYTLSEIESRGSDARALLRSCDLLVDGRYERDKPERTRRWIGSTNQVMHFLSDRYRADDPIFKARNTVEIRFSRGEISMNGWPDPLGEIPCG